MGDNPPLAPLVVGLVGFVLLLLGVAVADAVGQVVRCLGLLIVVMAAGIFFLELARRWMEW